MKTLLLCLIGTFSLNLCGCEVMHRPGIVIKEKVAYTGKYGAGEKMQDKVSINADMPGLEIVEAAGVRIQIAQVRGQNSTASTDPKTNITTTTTSETLGGLYVSGAVAARGEADKSRAKEFWAGVTGTLLSWGGAMFGAGLLLVPLQP